MRIIWDLKIEKYMLIIIKIEKEEASMDLFTKPVCNFESKLKKLSNEILVSTIEIEKHKIIK